MDFKVAYSSHGFRDGNEREELAYNGTFFDRDYLRQLMDQHQSGRRDYSSALWALLMFDAFLRNVLDRSETQPLKKTA